jgi:pimeloyl-ACP methyl ester carboxylesterase
MQSKKQLLLALCLVMLLHNNACRYFKKKEGCDKADNRNWVTTHLGCIHIKSYKNDQLKAHPNLVIVLHGDAPNNLPGYQYRMAFNLAVLNENTVAVGVLRPGYKDPENYSSDGEKGFCCGDNYTRYHVDAIAQLIQQLQAYYHPSKTILLGHSGGAAISANVAGLYPNLLDATVLVACPCDVPAWRKYMSTQQPSNDDWKESVSSISPQTLIDSISPNNKMVLISGDYDEVVPMDLSVRYYEELLRKNKQAQFIRIPYESHEIMQHDSVMLAMYRLLH